MTAMWAEADRRKRLLAIRHGLELRLKAGLHMAAPHAAARGFDDAATMALRLNDQAAPGVVLTSPAARRRLRQASSRPHPPAPADHA
jgi:class 3 adenylate cyclase